MFSAARELRFHPEEKKKQGAADLHSVQLCVLVMTTMHTINKPPKEPCRVESSRSTLKKQINATQTLACKVLRGTLIHPDLMRTEARSGDITVWTAGTIDQLHALPFLQQSRNF